MEPAKRKSPVFVLPPLPIHRAPPQPNRIRIVMALLESLNLLDNMVLKECQPASLEDCSDFHDEEYLEYLQQRGDSADSDDRDAKRRRLEDFHQLSPHAGDAEFGLVGDCSPYHGMWSVVRWMTGATLTAVNHLVDGTADIAINFWSGRHHAHADHAAGMCFVNDVVLAAMKLEKRFGTVLVVDLDVHHGDGTEAAFYFTDRVVHLSVHQFGDGLFPGTGSADSRGAGTGINATYNLPFPPGTVGSVVKSVFNKALDDVLRKYTLSSAIIVVGTDVVQGDPLGTLNVSPTELVDMVGLITELTLPTLILGAGGYNDVTSARCFALIAEVAICRSQCVSQKLVEQEVPPECSDFALFGPDYRLIAAPGPTHRPLATGTDSQIETISQVVLSGRIS